MLSREIIVWIILVLLLCCPITRGLFVSKGSHDCINRKLLIHMGEKKGPAQNDLLSRFVSRFLPTPEDIGLSRYDSSSKPENYPCTKSRWAELLPEDNDSDMKLLRPLLAQTNLEFRPIKLVYSASRDGWKAAEFHRKVDAKGPAVVLARTVSGGVIGGYNPTGWVNLGEYRGSIAAFLFTFPGGKTDRFPVKLAKIAGAGMAQIDDGSGPKFGMEGLTIPLASASPKKVLSKLGLYYERMPNSDNSLLPSNVKQDYLTELKVYAGVYEDGERIPFSGALFFALN